MNCQPRGAQLPSVSAIADEPHDGYESGCLPEERMLDNALEEPSVGGDDDGTDCDELLQEDMDDEENNPSTLDNDDTIADSCEYLWFKVRGIPDIKHLLLLSVYTWEDLKSVCCGILKVKPITVAMGGRSYDESNYHHLIQSIVNGDRQRELVIISTGLVRDANDICFISRDTQPSHPLVTHLGHEFVLLPEPSGMIFGRSRHEWVEELKTFGPPRYEHGQFRRCFFRGILESDFPDIRHERYKTDRPAYFVMLRQRWTRDEFVCTDLVWVDMDNFRLTKTFDDMVAGVSVVMALAAVEKAELGSERPEKMYPEFDRVGDIQGVEEKSFYLFDVKLP